MGAFMFLAAVVVEVMFAVFCIVTKSNQQKAGSIIRIAAFAGFLLLAALSIIDWGIRYYALASLLLLLAVIGAVALIRKKEEKRGYKTVRIIFKATGMILLFFAVTLPAILFPQHEALKATGRYKVATAAYSYTDKNVLKPIRIPAKTES